MTSPETFLAERRTDIRDVKMWSPFAYHNRKLRALIRAMVADCQLPSGARVLDYGCADAPYRSELPMDAHYLGADLSGNPAAQLTLRPDGAVPLPDDDVDLVLSTQVLEHVDDPSLYLSESYRVLRPGGSILLTTHGIMYYHRDPVDHWRWTRTGLTKLVQGAGFQVHALHGVMGLTAAALQLFQDGTYSYLPKVLRPIYALLMQSAIAFADRFYSDESRIDNGLVIAALAVKPGLAGSAVVEH